MPDIPHFTIPFQWGRSPLGGLQVLTVEQDSTSEIAGCCEAILRTVQGQRTSMPEFGRPELEFSDPEFSQSAVASALVTFEPRVESLVTANPDDDDPEIQLVQALIAPSDGTEGDMT